MRRTPSTTTGEPSGSIDQRKELLFLDIDHVFSRGFASFRENLDRLFFQLASRFGLEALRRMDSGEPLQILPSIAREQVPPTLVLEQS